MIDPEFEVEIYLETIECIDKLKQELDNIDGRAYALKKWKSDEEREIEIMIISETDLANIEFLRPEDRVSILTWRKNINKLSSANLNQSGSILKDKICSLVRNAASKYKRQSMYKFLAEQKIKFLEDDEYRTWERWLPNGYLQYKQHSGFYMMSSTDLSTNVVSEFISSNDRAQRGYKLAPPESILDLIIEADKIFENLEIRTMGTTNGEQALFGLYDNKVYLLGRWIEFDPSNLTNLVKSDQRLLPFEKIKTLVENQKWGVPQPSLSVPKSGFFGRIRQRLLPT